MAPMKPEIRPLIDMLSLQKDQLGDLQVRTGAIGDVDVVATITGIGMDPAEQVTNRLLDAIEVDHVMVVGIAGGVGPSVEIGDLVLPEVIVDGRTGTSYRPHHIADGPARGTIISSDQFGYDDDTITRFIGEGVVALDMETGAVAAACEQRGVPWSAYRAISDRGDDDTVDKAVLELAGPDGGGNFSAVARYLVRHPGQIVHLARLAKGTKLATKAAAEAAIAACRKGELSR
jgi:nucleoside phosphorylase